MSILLVDDNADELAVMETLLRTSGAAVTAVSKVEDALRETQKRRRRVLVSDLMIPGHDGFTLIRRIRRMEEDGEPRLPALAISGLNTPDQRRFALEEGFDDYLAKPVHEGIVAAVTRLGRPRRRS